MTLKEITARKQALEKELRELEGEEKDLRDGGNRKKFLNKFFIVRSLKLAMHVIQVDGVRVFGEGVDKKGDGIFIGRFSIQAPENPIFVSKQEFLDYIQETSLGEFIYNDYTSYE